ncbi:MAG TPA: DUF2993 domain-containing protein [Mycobacteriales bacterium]
MRKLLASLLALAVLLVIVDRVSSAVAAGVLADQIRTEASLGTDPHVTFGGFPFLTQAADGRYHDVRVAVEGVPVGRLRGVAVDAHLHDVHLPLADVVGRHVGRIPVDQVTGTATVAYPELARAVGSARGARIDSVSRDGDGLKVRATASIAGQELTATARASVRVDQGALVVTANRVTVDNLPGNALGAAALAGQLSFRVPLDGLPFNLRVTDVHVGDHGLGVSAQAHDVVLNGAVHRGG